MTVWLSAHTAAALVCLVFGWFQGRTITRRIRQGTTPGTPPDGALVWEEPAGLRLSAQVDPFATVWVAGHLASLFLLAILLVFSLSSDPWLFRWSYYSLLGVMGVGIAWGRCGIMLNVLFPFPPVRVHLIEEGIGHGSALYPWDRFSHFGVRESTGAICLYTARNPEMILLAYQPPTRQILEQAVTRLARHLPSAPPSREVAWHQRRSFYNLLFVLLALVPPGIGLWLAAGNTPGAWFYDAAAQWFSSYLAATLFQRYQGVPVSA